MDDLQWCAHHGHLVLTLGTTTRDRRLFIAIGTEDAQGLAVTPAQTPNVRTHSLVEALLAGLNASMISVELTFGADHLLTSQLHIAGHTRDIALPAHFADGIALAQRARVPLWMSERDLQRARTAR